MKQFYIQRALVLHYSGTSIELYLKHQLLYNISVFHKSQKLSTVQYILNILNLANDTQRSNLLILCHLITMSITITRLLVLP